MPIDFLTSAIVTLFVVVDPVGLVPTFIAVTAGLPRRAAAGCDPRLRDRGTHSRRLRVDRELAVDESRHRHGGLSHRRRLAAVLDRIRNGVRAAHRPPGAHRRAGDRGACAQYRGVPARHSLDGRSRRHHRDHPVGRARRGRPAASRPPHRCHCACMRALPRSVPGREPDREAPWHHRQYRAVAAARRAAAALAVQFVLDGLRGAGLVASGGPL